jgi:hypothetical protein
MNEPKRMKIKDFRNEGYLREVNRRFFHRLGMALEVVALDGNLFNGDKEDWDKFDKEMEELFDKVLTLDLMPYQKKLAKNIFSTARAGIILGGVHDYRDDPEGMCFGSIDKLAVEQGERITKEMESKKKARETAFGFDVQPLTEHEVKYEA